MTVREDARRCQRCDYQWYAAPTLSTKSPPEERRRWSQCANCGSARVQTVRNEGFVPSGNIGHMASPAPAQWAASRRVESRLKDDAWKRATVSFLKIHWRLIAAVIATIMAISAPFRTDVSSVGEKIAFTIFFALSAILFWCLVKRRMDYLAANPAPTTAKAKEEPVAALPHQTLDVSIDDAWSAMFRSCQNKSAKFHEVGTVTRSAAVSEWLVDVSRQISKQLPQVEELAALGRSIDPQAREGEGSPSAQVMARLQAFEAGLDRAIANAVNVRLRSLDPDADSIAIQEQFGMLEEQLPVLE